MSRPGSSGALPFRSDEKRDLLEHVVERRTPLDDIDEAAGRLFHSEQAVQRRRADITLDADDVLHLP